MSLQDRVPIERDAHALFLHPGKRPVQFGAPTASANVRAEAFMVHAPFTRDLIEVYFERKAASETKHELVSGVLYAMAGASARHNELCFQFEAGLRAALAGRGCYVASRDQRVAVDIKLSAPSGRGTYVYPDGVVACPPGFNRDRPASLLNPMLVVEVLLRDTRRDRADKLDAYRDRSGLDDILFARTDVVLVEHHHRVTPDQCLVTLHRRGTLAIEGLGVELDLGALCAGVGVLPVEDGDDLESGEDPW